MADLSDTAQLERILNSVGVTQYDTAVLDALQIIVDKETEAIKATAHTYAVQTGNKPTDADVVALACKAHRFASAPSREASLESARMLNARPVAWPLGAQLRVPLEYAAAHRADAVLSETAPLSGMHRFPAAISEGSVQHAAVLPSPSGVFGVSSITVAGKQAAGTGAGAGSARTAAALAAFASAFDEQAPAGISTSSVSHR